jgi:hypothetical protein
VSRSSATFRNQKTRVAQGRSGRSVWHSALHMHMNFMQSMLVPDELSKVPIRMCTPAIDAAAAASNRPSRLDQCTSLINDNHVIRIPSRTTTATTAANATCIVVCPSDPRPLRPSCVSRARRARSRDRTVPRAFSQHLDIRRVAQFRLGLRITREIYWAGGRPASPSSVGVCVPATRSSKLGRDHGR